jgi:hypothetical protein
MPEGWFTDYGAPGAGKPPDTDGEVGFYFVVPTAFFADPCVGTRPEEWQLAEFGPTVDDLVTLVGNHRKSPRQTVDEPS